VLALDNVEVLSSRAAVEVLGAIVDHSALGLAARDRLAARAGDAHRTPSGRTGASSSFARAILVMTPSEAGALLRGIGLDLGRGWSRRS
jgi:hypothetical protein